MSDIKVPPFTDGQKELIKMTEKLANGRKICDVDDIDDDKDIKEILKEAITEIENQKQTNFQRITATPETLANYIGGVINYALRKESERSKTDHKRYSNMFQGFGHAIEWLKQESE